MATLPFDELEVYQAAERLTDEVWDIVRTWDNFAKDTVGKQLVRAADSIGANIAEGCGRQSYKDNQRFVKIARGSLNETRHWLRRAYRRKLLTPEQVAALKPVLDSLPKRLNAYLRSIGDPSRASRGEPAEG
ncbi:MAG: four helix bundle protein [Isosphaera sp.]|nr:four helix bundle protein [Isosphaera sp.]